MTSARFFYKLMKILYEDESIVVIGKPAGLAVQTKNIAEEDALSLLRKETRSPYLAPINRLDQPVRGLVLFAKSKTSAAVLSKDLTLGKISKFYRAKVYGSFEKKEGELRDILYKDAKTNTSRVVKPGEWEYKDGKEAVLEYKETAPGELSIRLITGRHHQIRVQLANAGHPILGDVKYGNEESKAESKEKGIRTIALTAERLIINHPVTKKRMEFIYEE